MRRPSPSVQVAYISAIAAALVLAALSLLAEVQPGDTRAAVVKQLGRPKGSLMREQQEILWYARGSIELKDGTVTLVKLISPEELREQQRRAEARAQEEARRYAELRQAGEAERDRMMSDTNLMSKSAADQVAAWDEFQKKYPVVDTAKATEKVREQVQADEEAARKAQLEQSEPKPKPRLSASKRRRYRRAGDTNMVDIASPPGDEAP